MYKCYCDAITVLRSTHRVHFCWIFSLMAHSMCFHARYVLLGVRLNFLIISIFIGNIPKIPIPVMLNLSQTFKST